MLRVDMSFVFISHCSRDKDRIRHIVQALIAAGEKVWLDNPSAMNFSAAEIASHFIHRLHAGRPHQEEINEALKRARVVLGCFSERYKDPEREAWRKEIHHATVEGKLVCCRVDDIDPNSLPSEISAQQMPDLRVDMPTTDGSTKRLPRNEVQLDAAIKGLVEDIRRMQQDVSSRAIADRGLDHAKVPYLINRENQEEIIGDAIRELDRARGIRAFLLMGPDNECPDKFIDRLTWHTCRDAIRKSWHRTNLVWPADASPREFASMYQRRLAKELRVSESGKTQAKEIAKALAHKDAPVAVVSTITAREWRLAEPQRITAWLTWWKTLAADSPEFAAIPMLTVVLPEASPKQWRGDCPNGRWPGAELSNAQIWQAAQRVAVGKSGLTFLPFIRRPSLPVIGAPKPLHPVQMVHARNWLEMRSDLIGMHLESAREAIDDLFNSDEARRHGVSLADFASKLAPVFKGGPGRLR